MSYVYKSRPLLSFQLKLTSIEPSNRLRSPITRQYTSHLKQFKTLISPKNVLSIHLSKISNFVFGLVVQLAEPSTVLSVSLFSTVNSKGIGQEITVLLSSFHIHQTTIYLYYSDFYITGFSYCMIWDKTIENQRNPFFFGLDVKNILFRFPKRFLSSCQIVRSY